MKHHELQHIIRAAAAICEESDFIVIGSQAIHGSLPHVDESTLVRSIEADLYPRYAPEKSQLLNAIGEFSPFHETYGYYADGVDNTTATLPAGWEDRLIVVSGPLTNDARGWCLELHDLAISKLVAGRAKDLDFVRALVKLGAARQKTTYLRLEATKLAVAKKQIIQNFLENAFD